MPAWCNSSLAVSSRFTWLQTRNRFPLIHVTPNIVTTTIYYSATCLTKARFPFKRNRLRCVNENRKKRKRLRWQAANHGCHCFNRAFLLVGACVCCVKIACVSCGFRLRNASDFVWMETGLDAGFSHRHLHVLHVLSNSNKSFTLGLQQVNLWD